MAKPNTNSYEQQFTPWIPGPIQAGETRGYCPLCQQPHATPGAHQQDTDASYRFNGKGRGVFTCHRGNCGWRGTMHGLAKEMRQRGITAEQPASTGNSEDASDSFNAELAGKEPAWSPQPQGDNGTGQLTQSDVLIAIATERYEFIKGDVGEGEPFALPRNGANIARPLRGSQSFRAELSADFYDVQGKVPNSNALANVLLTLEGRTYRLPPTSLALRVARHGNGLVVDLGYSNGRAVVIEPGDWRIVQRSPVTFRRTSITKALPLPEDGDVSSLRPLVNIPDEMWPLVIAYMVAALLPDVPHPVLAFTGEQGTGKSWTTGRIIQLLDPTSTPLRAVQKELEDWVVAANASWVVGLENLSHIDPWLSDAMCRAVTGDSLLRRKRYTDSDVAAVAFRRVVLLNGIALGVIRGDLADRMILVELEQLQKRRTERALEHDWNFAYPVILGGLYTVATAVLAELPHVTVSDPPRMVDYAHVLAAVDRVLGTRGLEVYRGMWGRLAADVTESDVVARALMRWMEQRATWTGTAGELLEELDKRVGVVPPQGWPRTAQGMAWALKRVAPALRSQGLHVQHLEREGHERQRPWHLRNPDVVPTPEQQGW